MSTREGRPSSVLTSDDPRHRRPPSSRCAPARSPCAGEMVDAPRRARGGRRRSRPCSSPWATRAGRCGRPPPSTSPRFAPALLLPALEAALRDGENAGDAQRGHGDLRAAAARRPCPPLLALLARRGRGGAQLRRRDARARCGTAAPSQPLIAALADPDVNVRHAAAASLGQIGDAGGGAAPGRGAARRALAPVPGHPRPGRDRRPARRPGPPRAPGRRVLPRARPSRPWAAWPTATRCRSWCPTSTTPSRPSRNLAIRAVVAIEQRATAGGESLDPEVQAALRARGPGGPPARRCWATTTRRTGARPSSPWAGCKEPRAERAAGRPPGRAGAAGVREPRPRLHRLRGPRGLSTTASPTPTTRCAQGTRALPGLDRAARRPSTSWRPSSTTRRTEVRAEAVAAIGRLGDEDAAMLLFELLGDESEVIQESAMSALARMAPGRAWCPCCCRPSAARRPRCASARPRPWASCASPTTAPALVALCPGPAGERAARRPARPWARSRRPRRARRAARGASATRAAWCASRPCPPWASSRSRRRPQDLLPLLDDPDPQDALRGRCAPSARSASLEALPTGSCPSSPTSGRSCASPRSRPWARIRAAGRGARARRRPARPRPQPAPGRGREPGLRSAIPQAVPPLLLALEDEHWSVRCGAAAALGRIGSAKALPALLAAPRRTRTRRCGAPPWRALGEIGDARAARPPDAGPRRPRPPVHRARGPAAPGAGRPARDGAGLPAAAPRGAAAARGPRRAASRTARAAAPAPRRPRRRRARPCAPRRRWPWATAAFAEALRALMDLKATDPSPEVRKAAALALKKLAPR